jgi:hypothetical protein
VGSSYVPTVRQYSTGVGVVGMIRQLLSRRDENVATY